MGAEESTSRRSGLTAQEIQVLKANTNLNEAEIREGYDEFIAESPSGKMNKAQFRKLYKKLAGPDASNNDITDMVFQAFDTNGDGTVNFSEFTLGVALNNKKDLDSGLDLAFAIIDASHDGNISYQEMVKFVEISLKAANDNGETDPKLAATMIFGMFDLDKNQKLSKKQFIEGVKKNDKLQKIFSGFSD